MNEDGKNGLNTENQDDKAVNANENKPKRFRDKALSVIQKIILVFLACLMLITVLPVGMFKRVNPVEKKRVFDSPLSVRNEGERLHRCGCNRGT